MHITFSRGISRNEIFQNKDREESGGTTTRIIWLAPIISQDHPMTPDRLWVTETKIHFVVSVSLNYLKYKKQLLLVEPPPASIQSSVSHAEVFDQFRSSVFQ